MVKCTGEYVDVIIYGILGRKAIRTEIWIRKIKSRVSLIVASLYC